MSQSTRKIIIIGPAHPLRPGGITTFNERLCKAFNDEGYECIIYSFSLQYPSFLFPGSNQYTDAPPPHGLVIKSVINSVNPFNWFRVARLIKKEKADLIICRYWIPFMGPALGTILRLCGGLHQSITVIADNIVPHEKRKGDKFFTRYFIPPVSRFIVMSQKVFNDLRKFTLKPAKLVPHPLYDNFGEAVDKVAARKWLKDKYGFNINEKDSLLLFFGIVRDYKGLDILLQALPTLELENYKLIIAGEWYIDRKHYSEWLDKPELADKVICFDKFVPSEDVRYFFCASDCVVQPYRSATQSGVTPVAYHFEIPMIVTNVGGLAELVPHGKAGIVCEPEPFALAKAIETYFEIGGNVFEPGLKQVKQKLSWKSLVDTLVGFEAKAAAN